MKTAKQLVPTIESAFAHLHGEVQNCERALRTRISELEAA